MSGNLYVEILSAKALNVDDQRVSYLQLHILYDHQVIRSSPLLSRTISDPIFNFSCSFPLQHLEAMNTNTLLNLNSPVLIYLTNSTDSREEKNCCGIGGVRSLIAAAVIDFRYSLLHSEEYISVELLPCELDGVHMGVSAGTPYGCQCCILFARLRLSDFPLAIIDYNQLTQQEIEDAIWNYQSKIADENRVLYQIARNWWSKAIETYPHISSHVFKIIAEDELGYHRSVCSLLTPIQPDRSLINPKFSARYVSLIPFRRDIGLTGGRVETWRSCHAMMSRLQGDVEDHAILLCSMLMGWGLDAWIGLGTIVSVSDPSNASSNKGSPKEFIHRPYCWVMTFDRNSDPDSNDKEPNIIFWEAVSGKQYEIPHRQTVPNSRSKPHVFGELHALFRNDCYLINIQPTCLVNGGYSSFEPLLDTASIKSRPYMSFDLSNERYFLPFPRHAISPVLLHPGGGVTMKMNSIYPSITSEAQIESLSSPLVSEPKRISYCKTQLMNSDCVQEIEIYLEEQLRDFIATFRLERDLYTHYDSELSPILQVS
jgi:hypothetical protein